MNYQPLDLECLCCGQSGEKYLRRYGFPEIEFYVFSRPIKVLKLKKSRPEMMEFEKIPLCKHCAFLLGKREN